MDLYTCKVRLAGSADNEVIKHNVTAAEIHLLTQIHAGEGKRPPVVDIEKTGTVNRTDGKERARLAEIYTKGELVEDRGSKMVQALFGVAGVPLPQTYVAPVVEAVEEYNPDEEVEEEVITPVEKPVRTKVASKTEKKHETVSAA